jgi:hypothetical protein
MKKKIFLFTVFVIFTINSGISVDTIIETSDGFKEIRTLQIGDKVICLDKDLNPDMKPIVTIHETKVDSYIEITTEDNLILHSSPDQRVFIPYKWIQVDQLSLGDYLVNRDRTFTKIIGIRYIQEPTILRFIVIEENHNFLATKKGILIHNGVGGATGGFFVGKILTSVVGHGSIQLISWGVGLFCPPAGVATSIALESALSAPIEAMSLKVGLACGILCGTASGPV